MLPEKSQNLDFKKKLVLIKKKDLNPPKVYLIKSDSSRFVTGQGKDDKNRTSGVEPCV